MSTAFPPSAWIWPFLHKNRPSSFIIDDSARFVNQESEVQEKKVTALTQAACPLSRACARQLSQRESLWRVGQLSPGREKHDVSETAVLRCPGQQQLDKVRCPEAATPVSKARPFAPCRAFSGQAKVARLANGSPFGGAVTAGD